MKSARVLLVILVLGAIIAVLPGCKADTGDDNAGNQVASVIRGNLTLEISAAGNLALSETQDLAFEVAGTVLEVGVDVGDIVNEGQVLARLDTKEWDKTLKTLQAAVTTAERAVDTKQAALVKAQRDATAAARNVSAKEMAVQEAELAVETARNTLDEIQVVKEAQDDVDAAQLELDIIHALTTGAYASLQYAGSVADVLGFWALQKTAAQANLRATQEDLQAVLDTTDVTLTDNVVLQIKQAQFNITKKQVAVLDAQLAVDDANYAVTVANDAVKTAQYGVDDANSALEDAKANLADAQGKSPEIIAPFDGFITKINVEGGDEVLKGTVAMQIADPDKFEADILVSEMDIPKVNIGDHATVMVSAMPTAILTATVTHISPTAIISSGVVNYNVKVEVQPPGSSPFGPFGGATGPTGNVTMPPFSSNFTPPEGFPPPGDFEMPEGAEFPDFSGFQMPAQTDIQLREGLTVTVSITVASRTDVLLVPNGAVITEGLQSYVQVIEPTGETEKRPVTVGISNWQFTEIIEGLDEGEQVSVTLNLAPDFGDFGGGMMFMGGSR